MRLPVAKPSPCVPSAVMEKMRAQLVGMKKNTVAVEGEKVSGCWPVGPRVTCQPTRPQPRAADLCILLQTCNAPLNCPRAGVAALRPKLSNRSSHMSVRRR